MAIGIDAMTVAATAAGCDYKPYTQMEAIRAGGLAADDGGGGICFGLAVVWLKNKFEKTFGGRTGQKVSAPFIDRAADPSSQTFALSHLYWKNQTSDAWQKQTGLAPAREESGSAKTREFDGPDELPAFVDWLCAAAGDRYFLVHVPGHTMAAIGSKTGRIQFFDPNAGIVSTRFKRKMVACLGDYFATPDILKHYKQNPQGRVVLRVEKFH